MWGTGVSPGRELYGPVLVTESYFPAAVAAASCHGFAARLKVSSVPSTFSRLAVCLYWQLSSTQWSSGKWHVVFLLVLVIIVISIFYVNIAMKNIVVYLSTNKSWHDWEIKHLHLVIRYLWWRYGYCYFTIFCGLSQRVDLETGFNFKSHKVKNR